MVTTQQVPLRQDICHDPVTDLNCMCNIFILCKTMLKRTSILQTCYCGNILKLRKVNKTKWLYLYCYVCFQWSLLFVRMESKACEFQNHVKQTSCAQGNKSMWKGLNTSLFFICICVLSVTNVMLIFVWIQFLMLIH